MMPSSVPVPVSRKVKTLTVIQIPSVILKVTHLEVQALTHVLLFC